MSERRVPHRPLRACIDLSRVGLDLSDVRLETEGARESTSACLLAALRSGITWVDVGASPGMQKLVADVVADAGVSPPVIVVSIHGDELGVTSRHGGVSHAVRAVVDRLRTDRIDLLLVEGRTAVTDGTWRALLDLVQEGSVGVIGLRDPTRDVLLSCHACGRVDAVSIEVGVGHRTAIRDVLGWCVTNEIDVLGRALLAFPRSAAVVEALRSAELRHGNAADVVLVAWTLAWPGITAVAFPASTAEEVDRRVDAAQLKLTVDDLDVIAAALRADGTDDTGFERPRMRA